VVSRKGAGEFIIMRTTTATGFKHEVKVWAASCGRCGETDISKLRCARCKEQGSHLSEWRAPEAAEGLLLCNRCHPDPQPR
jgi:predicted RNA-binding Zn-ribbon protein involved in translation (DUF1610 family)